MSITYSHLDTLYGKLVEIKDAAEFRTLYVRFTAIVLRNRYYLVDAYYAEIHGMSAYLEEARVAVGCASISPFFGELLETALAEVKRLATQ